MKIKITFLFIALTSLMLLGCKNKENDPLSYDGISLGNSYAELLKKHPNMKCEKNTNKFVCINKNENGATKYSINSNEKISSIRSYWISQNMTPYQILEIYESRFGKPTKINTFNNIIAMPEYYCCTDKDCQKYRMYSYETPKGKKCLGDISEDYEINDICDGKSFVFYLSLSDMKNSVWYDKTSKEFNSIK